MIWIDISVLAAVLAALCAWLVVVLALRARRSRRRFELLGEVAAISESATSLEETFERICELLVPELADFCMIDTIGEDGRPRRAAVRVAPGGPAAAERHLREREPSVPPAMVGGEDASPAPRFFERMSEADLRELAHDEDDLRSLRDLGTRSAITLALQARGQVKGALTLGVAWSGRRYKRDDARFAWILSGRVALTLDNCGLFADLERVEGARAEIAETLQRGLLPPSLPHVPGWTLAAMYRPAGAQNEVGGDFYDAFRVAGGWVVAIGDVTGRGARAASITAVARYTLRTAALLTNDLTSALATVNRALRSRGDTSLCSIAALSLSDDPRRPVRVAVAGHPPPLLVDGEAVEEVCDAGPLLGAFGDGTWRVHDLQVEPGRHLVMATDGITETGGRAERFGEERLRAEIAGAGGPAPAVQRIESALRSFSDESLDDDVAILAVSRAPTHEPSDAVAATLDDPATVTASEEAIGRLFDAFNQRDPAAIAELCAPEMEFVGVTAEEAGRATPYIGPEGLREYLEDVERLWEELLITASWIECGEDRLLVSGRVYVRSRELGIRDMPVAWIWHLEDGLFSRGEVFADPELAATRFAQAIA